MEPNNTAWYCFLSIPSGRFPLVNDRRQFVMDLANRRRQRTERRYNRLIELRDSACSGSAAEFARAMNMADTYAVRMFWPPGTKGRKGVGQDMEAAIIERFHLSPDWFDLPMGTALPTPDVATPAEESVPRSYGSPRTTDDEALLMRAFRAADPSVRIAWLDQARGIVERIHTPSTLTGTHTPKSG